MDTEEEITAGTGTEAAEEEKREPEREALLRELDSARARAREMEQALVQRDEALAALRESVADAERRLGEVNETLAQAVGAYRGLLVEANPGVLPELITGESIEALNESLDNARALVSRVKQEVEAEAARTRVPAGAPYRVALDLSALSSREKIQYGIGGKH
ncbi:MAG: hypothetical protein ABID87_02150 [Chloroflexota bacterium]